MKNNIKNFMANLNREMRLGTIRNVGNGFGVGRTIRSEKDKMKDPKKQRKSKSWMKEW